MQCSHTFPFPRSFITSQTQLLHINPAPRLIIRILSPFLSLFFASMYPSTYHSPPADVFPNRWSAIRAGSMSYSFSPKLFPSPSITALPPG
ncbi:hypothetical protein ERO13_D04G061001v2 [Gossypium hirsutum]|uniref:Uncharacterized protein n=1 Tax=Gossypium mustelinum TaxID=34275 RepID=A0A5D2VB02_GOSMU|nr:hypothetical protein ERO13_D04G061001v2 [Gossypium hirsutum]TYI86516.1 hypothetical protein E1A91_D04G069500v1 [Gossypium mustelinum]